MPDFNMQQFKKDTGPYTEFAIKRFRDFEATEEQLIHLVRLFVTRGYLTPDQLLDKLMEQPLPQINLDRLTSYMAGYLTAKNHHADLSTRLFGASYGSDRDNDVSVFTAFAAMLEMSADRDILPDRSKKPMPEGWQEFQDLMDERIHERDHRYDRQRSINYGNNPIDGGRGDDDDMSSGFGD